MTSGSVLLRLTVLSSVCALWSCSSTEPSTPTTVALSETVLSFDAIGSTRQLVAEVRDQRSQPLPDEPVTWSSNNTMVATVNSTGLITAVGNGNTTVVATSGSANGNVSVSVAQVVRQVERVFGHAQTDTVGRTLPDPLTARVLDRLGQPIVGQDISFIVAAGNGSVDPAAGQTDALGQVSTVWTLGTQSGTNHRVNASAVGLGLSAAFTATALAGAPDSVEKVQGDEQSGGVGLPLGDSIVIRVLDEFDNPVPALTVSFDVAVGSGSASPASVNVGALGRAATQWTLGADAGEDTLLVTAGNLSTVTFTATAVVAGPPANVEIVDGDGQTGLVGFAVNIPPTVRVTDAQGIPISSTDVSFTVTGGGGMVSDATVQTDSEGIATVGSWTLGASPATNTLDASITVDAETFTAAGITGAYDIEVRFLTTPTASQEQAFLDAADRWGVVIFGDLPDFPMSVDAGECGENSPALDEVVDDLLILATLDSIDGPGGILGQAGPCFARDPTIHPFLGLMIFDTADLADVEAAGNLDELILHEMGHVIGLGTVWSFLGLLSGGGGSDPHFNGMRAIEAFDRVGGASYMGGGKVPVENMFGPATRDSHWRESIFDEELMTGFLNPGIANPLSEVTTASFWDMGYLVNLDGSDDYTLSLSGLRIASGRDIRLFDDVLNIPLRVVDRSGRILKVLRGR